MNISATPKERSSRLTFWMILPETLLYFALGAATIACVWKPALSWVAGMWQQQAIGSLVVAGSVAVLVLIAAGWLSGRIGFIRSVAVFVLAVGVLAFLLTGFGVHLPNH